VYKQKVYQTGSCDGGKPGAPQDGVQPPAAASVERDADPLFPAPDDVTRPVQLLARDHQREAVGNKQRGHNFECGPGLREISDGAGNFIAGERDRAGLQDAPPRSDALFVSSAHDNPSRWARRARRAEDRAMPARSGPCRRMRLSACLIERPPGVRESATKIRRLCPEPLAPRDVDSVLPVKPPNHQPGVKPPKVGGLGVTPYPALRPFVLWRREKPAGLFIEWRRARLGLRAASGATSRARSSTADRSPVAPAMRCRSETRPQRRQRTRDEAANWGGLPSCRGRLNVRCEGRRMRRRAWFVYLQIEVGRLVQESCGNLGVLCCFGQPKQDRRLTHEVLFSDHLTSPVVSQRRCNYSGIGAFVPSRRYKSELKDGGVAK
jgi:hypothetical protein